MRHDPYHPRRHGFPASECQTTRCAGVPPPVDCRGCDLVVITATASSSRAYALCRYWRNAEQNRNGRRTVTCSRMGRHKHADTVLIGAGEPHLATICQGYG